MGFHVAAALAGPKHRFRTIIACRDESKGTQAVSEIVAEDPDASVCFLPLDLASLASVRAFEKAFVQLDEDPAKTLHLLVNNAGVGFGQDKTRTLTVDGFEARFGVNHLGHFLLCNLLLPYLKAATAPPARVVNVASSLHDPKSPGAEHMGPPADTCFDDLQLERMDPFDPTFAYNRSKLCNILFTYELQRRLRKEGSAVAVNALCPGFIPATGLAREQSGCARFMLRYVLDGVCSSCAKITRTPKDGAECQLRCAVDPLAATGGQYFHFTREGKFEALPSSETSYDEAKQLKLWEVSAELTGLA
jgi:NAD(P)-dependent dehydrogenase (short-subunit alcohol dehydrogenase family)